MSTETTTPTYGKDPAAVGRLTRTQYAVTQEAATSCHSGKRTRPQVMVTN